MGCDLSWRAVQADLDNNNEIDFSEFVNIASGSLGVDLSAACCVRCQNSSLRLLWTQRARWHACTAVGAPLQFCLLCTALAFGWSEQQPAFAVGVGLHPIVTLQYSSTTSYQVYYHI